MAWTTPSTVVAGQTPSAAFWNEQVRDNTNYLYNIAGPGVKSLLKTDTQSATIASGASTPILKQGNGVGDNFEISHAVADASNRVVVMASATGITDSLVQIGFFLSFDGSPSVYIGDAAGVRVRLGSSGGATDNRVMSTVPLFGIFSPGDTSAHTYGISMQKQTTSGAAVMYINRSVTDTNDLVNARAITFMLLFEIGPAT